MYSCIITTAGDIYVTIHPKAIGGAYTSITQPGTIPKEEMLPINGGRSISRSSRRDTGTRYDTPSERPGTLRYPARRVQRPHWRACMFSSQSDFQGLALVTTTGAAAGDISYKYSTVPVRPGGVRLYLVRVI